MAITISRIQKLRLLFVAGFILLLILITSKYSKPPQNNYHHNYHIKKIASPELIQIALAISTYDTKPVIKPSFKLRKAFDCDNLTPATKFSQRGSYWTLNNFIIGRKRYNCDESVTYTTHAEFGFLMDNLVPLAQRWAGPVSLSIFVPGTDFEEATKRLIWLRECSPHSDLIKDYVTVHFYFPSKNLPTPLSEDFEKMIFNQIDCNTLAFWNLSSTAKSYRSQHSLTYPINVGRNLAKETSTTKYVLASDIELYPNPGLVNSFLKMISNYEETNGGNKVFVLPIFEIDASLEQQLPEDKKQLVSLLENKLAVPFHYRICPHCHKIPRAEEWVLLGDKEEEDLKVFHVANRTGIHAHWEPIYIGTKDDPGYDERLNWEGLKDKMTQVHSVFTWWHFFVEIYLKII